LLTSQFLAGESESWEGVLKQGIYRLRKGLGVNESVMWGENFLIAALDAILEYKRSDDRKEVIIA